MSKLQHTFIALGLFLSGSLYAQTNVRIETQRQDWNKDLMDVRLHFNSEAHRRYLVEVSGDLERWEPHYLTPFEASLNGYWVRQVDTSNPYSSRAQFYRVAQLSWSFQTLDNSGDWIGDLSLVSNGSEAFVVYQNRYTNTLHYSVSDQDGRFGQPSVIESTGAVDEPGFWDNSGYSNVSIIHYDAVLYLVCTDDIAKKVIMLRKDDNCMSWTRHEISGVIDAHYWAFPKFAISPTGILGVAYRSNEGTVFSYASHASPEDWQTVFLTTNTPHSRFNLKTKFSTDSHANIYIRYYGSFRVATDDGSVASEPYPDDPPSSDLTAEEIERVASTTRIETQSNHVRLPDGRLVIALTNAWRVIVAVED